MGAIHAKQKAVTVVYQMPAVFTGDFKLLTRLGMIISKPTRLGHEDYSEDPQNSKALALEASLYYTARLLSQKQKKDWGYNMAAQCLPGSARS